MKEAREKKRMKKNKGEAERERAGYLKLLGETVDYIF